MRVDGEFLILEGLEVRAFNRFYMHLMADVGIKTAMKRTWLEVPSIPIDSRGAVVSAGLRTFGAFVIVRALRKDLPPLEVYDLAKEQAQVVLNPDREHSQGDAAREGGRFPRTSDRKIVVRPGAGQMTATVRPHGQFKNAVSVMRALGKETHR